MKEPTSRNAPDTYRPVPWYGDHCYLGLHVDFHAGYNDSELGDIDPQTLARQLRRMDVDYVQIDTKGGPGLTSYFAKTPGSKVCPVLKGDLVKAWRDATRQLGLPLHAHWIAHSDLHAIAEHPDWRRVDETGTPDANRICPSSGFVDQYMIPQLLELIGDWGLDGIWIDGQAWYALPCWCDRCKAGWREEGHDAPPLSNADPMWSRWMLFQRNEFDRSVNRYADAIHARFPLCRVCDNWSLTISQPGPPALHVDFISADDAAPFGLENMRLEARFTSTRGLPWDFMQWLFYGTGGMHEPSTPPTVRPVEHVMQEAAYILALGGNHQIYENPSPRRDGGLIDWRVDRIAHINAWCRKRQAVCQGASPWEDVAVLVSEAHFHRHAAYSNLLWSFEFDAVRGALSAAALDHRGVDVLDEWALLPRLDRFNLLIIPEQIDVSDELVRRVKAWVAGGGRLLLSGAAAADRWTDAFLGTRPAEISGPAVFHIPAGDERAPVQSQSWCLTVADGARSLGALSRSDDPQRMMTPYAAATVHQVEDGAVAWIPADIFTYFERSRYALVRRFIGSVMKTLGGKREVTVHAPLAVELILRKNHRQRIIHLINRSGGYGTGPRDVAVEQIPPVGPIELELQLDRPPVSVSAPLENQHPTWEWTQSHRSTLKLHLSRIELHEALVIGEGS